VSILDLAAIDAMKLRAELLEISEKWNQPIRFLDHHIGKLDQPGQELASSY